MAQHNLDKFPIAFLLYMHTYIQTYSHTLYNNIRNITQLYITLHYIRLPHTHEQARYTVIDASTCTYRTNIQTVVQALKYIDRQTNKLSDKQTVIQKDRDP